MIPSEKISPERFIDEGANNRSKCWCCGKQIVKQAPRMSMAYSSKFGLNHHRICGLCLIELADHCKSKYKEGLEAQRQKVVAEAI